MNPGKISIHTVNLSARSHDAIVYRQKGIQAGRSGISFKVSVTGFHLKKKKRLEICVIPLILISIFIRFSLLNSLSDTCGVASKSASHSTLCNPMAVASRDSSLHGILWRQWLVVVSLLPEDLSPQGSNPRLPLSISCTGGSFYHQHHLEAQNFHWTQ